MEPGKEDSAISIDEEVFNYRVDVPALIRISSAVPENGCISSLRCHGFPKGHAQAMAPGFYIFNKACGIDVTTIDLPAICSYKDEGVLDSLAIDFSISATNNKLYVVTVPLPLKSGKDWVSDTSDNMNTPLRVIKALAQPVDFQGNKMKTAIENASAADETIRGIHSKKGIGKVGA